VIAHRSPCSLSCATLGFAVLALMSAPALCWAQQRQVSYSASVSLYGSNGHGHDFNSAGQACFTDRLQLRRLNADGSTASLTPFGDIPNAGLATDAPGNCYLAIYTNVPGTQNETITIKKYNTSGVTDPTFTPFTLSGSGNYTLADMAVDSQGNIYVVGTTAAVDYPLVNNAQAQYGGGTLDGFIFKLSADGTHLIYSTFLGGSDRDTINAIAVDSSGAAYVVGQTYSTNFPTHAALIPTDPATQTQGNGSVGSGFVTKFDPNGAIVYSTYLGGTDADSAQSITVDGAGDAYIAGSSGANFPQVNPLPADQAQGGAYLGKLKADGSALLFSTFFGPGANTENFPVTQKVALDGAGNVYLTEAVSCGTGVCNGVASGFSFVQPLQQVLPSSNSEYGYLFVGEIASSGQTVLFSSLLAGPGMDQMADAGVDSSGNIYILGSTSDALNAEGYHHPSFGDGGEFPMINADSQPYGNGTLLFNGLGLNFFVRIAASPGTAFAAPDKIDFTVPPVVPGTSPPIQVVGSSYGVAPVELFNLGSTDVHISGIDVAGDFSGTNNCPGTLVVGSTTTSCSISLTFTPTAPGNRSGTVTIHDDAPGNPHVIQLVNALATPAPTLAISPTSLASGNQAVGTTSTGQTVTLTNTSPQAGAISLTHIGITGDFNETTTCGLTIQGYPCTITVTFTPTATGTRTGTITITDSDPSSPQTIILTGTGTNPQSPTLAPSTTGGGTQTVSAGQTATYSLSASGFTGTVSFACSGAPTAAMCMVNPATLPMPASGSGTVMVTVSTTARGALLVPSPWRLLPLNLWPLLYPITLAAMLVWLRFFVQWKRPRVARLTFATSLVLFAACALFAGCGGSTPINGGGNPQPAIGTPAGTYTITITGTAGSANQSTALTLVVK
jgi:hypothetical protein